MSYINQYTPLYDTGKWLIAKYKSTCRCGKPILPRDEFYYIPLKKEAQCLTCASQGYSPEQKQILT